MKKYYENGHPQGFNEIWEDADALRAQFMPYKKDNEEVLDDIVTDEELIIAINLDNNFFEIYEKQYAECCFCGRLHKEDEEIVYEDGEIYCDEECHREGTEPNFEWMTVKEARRLS